MPQMSPMNWMMISLMFLFIYNIMKINMNQMYNSKIIKKNLLPKKKLSLSW